MSDDFTGIDGIELADAVQAVRDELLTAAARGTGRDLRFEVGDINLEFTVELRRDARVKSGVRAWVISADADAGRSTARTHKVSFTLRPKDARMGGGWEVGNDGPADTSAFGTTG
ncbi:MULTISPECIES: trypco2 family protein [unclassified Streptomyces]|uniref:trypco2 family protein n=1 Tax=unclassified Streptomyces TaxID=2593676 RepID=UPI002DD94C5D|nr:MULTISPECIES: trypco2 family protein [unclassified Streptomyces]WSA91828.1 hypothetical protein OIE63_09840 [Streptomyces sp. NBC_01795]WSB76198.1 hypothetical protein OHB04_10640 [Streptomyces sp. NBC_01775]WSS44370.1 hypothetical protein OG220_30085 [Streptomyces sp. NBC_01187]